MPSPQAPRRTARMLAISFVLALTTAAGTLLVPSVASVSPIKPQTVSAQPLPNFCDTPADCSITLEKRANTSGPVVEGDIIIYTFIITNTGDLHCHRARHGRGRP